MGFIVDTWEVIFGGVGTAVVAALLAWYLRRPKSADEDMKKQEAKAGAHSQVVQAGRDANVGDFQANKDDSTK